MYLKICAWTLAHKGNVITGIVIGIAGYFAQIKGVMIVTLAAIILDLFLGIWAARVRGEAISSVKLWRTVYKTLIAVMLIHLLYAADIEFGFQEFKTYKTMAMFICGFEVWSMLENAAVITDHPAFRGMKKLFETKVKEKTGVEFNNCEK